MCSPGISITILRVALLNPEPSPPPPAHCPLSTNHFPPMRACLQRVLRAQVTVAGETCGRIERGVLVLLGVGHDDDEATARELARKIVSLRVFDDDEGKMNLALADVGGAMLVVSQFTLMGDCRKGRRPSFDAAARPEMAERLYEVFVQAVAEIGIPVSTGRFRANMMVELVNDGPVTLVVEA